MRRDLTDAQWKLVRPLIPKPKPGGRPQSVDRREIFNAIFYLRGQNALRTRPAGQKPQCRHQADRGPVPRLRLIWTDGAYQPVVGSGQSFGGWTLELVRKRGGEKSGVREAGVAAWATPPPDDPATALQTIDDWNETWVSICDTQDTNRIVLTEELREFIEETNYLARWCESAGLDSSPLIEYAHNAWDTYYGFHPTLPHIPDALWVLLERLKYRLHPFQLRPFAEQTSATQEERAASRSPPTRRTSWSGSSLSSTLMRRPAKSFRASVSPWEGL